MAVRKFVLLFVLLCGASGFIRGRTDALCAQGAPRFGCDRMSENCTGRDQLIRPSGMSSQVGALDFSFNGITTIRRLDFPPRLPSTARLNLSHNIIFEVQEAAFAGFLKLEELDLSSNCLSVIKKGTLRGLGKLNTLDLRDNQIAEVHLHAFSGLDALRIVWLQNNKLNNIPQAVTGLAALRVLSLANNRISQVDSGCLQGCRDLTTLHLQQNLISGVSKAAFRDLRRLQTLNLSDNLLETLSSSALQYLWEQGTEVHLHGNPWRCDCGLAELRGCAPARLTGGVKCHGGPLHGVPLSARSPGQLPCSRELRVPDPRTASVTEGTDLRLPCGNGSDGGKVRYWQTPFGRMESSGGLSRGDPVEILTDGSMKISRATFYHTGLYYCLLEAGEGRVIFPYMVECTHSTGSGEARLRKTREAETYQDAVSDAHFVAAVVSSVVLTFLGGFALGAFSRTHLNWFLQRVRPKRREGGGVPLGTLPMQYENRTFRKEADTSSPEGTISMTSNLEDAHVERVLPESSAVLGSVYLEGSDSSDCDDRRQDGGGNSQGEGEAENSPGDVRGKPRARGPRGDEQEGSSERDPDEEPSTRTSKRRVIKLYNYDEEGNRYGHIKDSEFEAAPRTKQRTLSLTRLNAIMAAASDPTISKELSPGDTAEQGKPDDGALLFQLSI
ncbi:hypothetical protein JZ751_025356 [Albula glossodonta]|uniref:Ig-like domain-containing protein n=1 Tax=Albula glossodonta TaxID=121402 RepID=A0A8T2NM77_9TELE|nr:hypothetical protein JZ751_025356 [Albula glossodonta]